MSSGSRESLVPVCPEPVRGLDWRTLPLTPADGFLLSRLDGATPPRLLVDLCGMPLADVLDALGRLERAGAIRWSALAAAGHGGATVEHRADPPAADPRAAEAATLAEACELGLDERRLILSVERRLPSLTHWALLELHGAPGQADVKRAYFAQSRRFHPDRYFGKELGSFKGRLERIFKAIRTAYEVLSDDGRRAKYAVDHPAPAAAVPLDETAPAAPAVSDEVLEARRRRILEDRRSARAGAPFSQDEAERLHARGLELLAAGEAAAAAAELRRALAHAPGSAEIRRAYDDATTRADAARVTSLVAEAEAVARVQPLVAAERLAEAFALGPAEVGYAVRAAELFLDAHELGPAWDVVQTALARSPRRRDLRLVAARVLEERGERQAALLQLETVASWEGADPHLASLIERLSRAVV